LTVIKVLKVYVHKGMRFGQKIILKGEGQEMQRHKSGDLIVVLVKKKDKHHG